MANPVELCVELAHTRYPIQIGPGLLAQLNERVDPSVNGFALISDQTVYQHYGQTVKTSLESTGKRVVELVVPAGEKSKSFERYQELLEQMLTQRMDRGSAVVALGGGVVGDLAGFVAASFMRGIRMIQIPTTLLAQVDSSVGGKVGINLPAAKNSVGAFWHPDSVFIDPHVLNTLDEDNIRSGLAEVVKYGVIMDAEFFAFLEKQVDAINRRDTDVMVQLIEHCCRLKAEVVQEDERETSGRRAILNYGHTFGHAIESCLGYGQVLHGHAVGMGMTAAAILAIQLGRVDSDFLERQTNLLEQLQIPFRFPTGSHQSMLEAMKFDKKNDQGVLRFILPTRLGHVDMVSSVEPTQVVDAMEQASQYRA